MGQFFNPTPPPPHKCQLPGYALSLGWRCECGLAYVKEDLPAWDTQPGELGWQWKRSPRDDSPTKD